MSEQLSPFDLYGKMLTAYVNACVEVNRAWFDNAARLGAGFFAPYPALRADAPVPQTVAAGLHSAPIVRIVQPVASEPDVRAAEAESNPAATAEACRFADATGHVPPAGHAGVLPMDPERAAVARMGEPATLVQPDVVEAVVEVPERHLSAETPVVDLRQRHTADSRLPETFVDPLDVAAPEKAMADVSSSGDGRSVEGVLAPPNAAPSQAPAPAIASPALPDADILNAVHDVLRPSAGDADPVHEVIAPPLKPAAKKTSKQKSRRKA